MAEQFKDGLEHLPLRERVAARAKAVAEMAAELTDTSPGRSGDMDTLRDKLNETTGLAKLLFEQQFIRHGGRKPADPEWSDLDESERDEWWDRALDAGPLIEGERSSRQAWAEEALRLEMELEHERTITAAYAEQARTHRCFDAGPTADQPVVEVQVCTVHPDGAEAADV